MKPQVQESDREKWFYISAGLGLGALIWWFFVKTPPPPARMTITKDVAPLEPPKELPSVGAVAVRFDEVRELYKMGYMAPSMAIAQTEDLKSEIAVLAINGMYEENSAVALLARMDVFLRDVRSFHAMTSPGA